jgi:hypothetical protein
LAPTTTEPQFPRRLAAESDAQVEAASAATVGPTQDAISCDLFAREQRLLD